MINRTLRALSPLGLTARLAVAVAFAALLYNPSPALAQLPPELGTAADFAVLAGTGVTCTRSAVSGNVGVYPGTAVTQTGCTISGTVHAGGAVAQAASNDFLAAYNNLLNFPPPCDDTFTIADTLAGVTLTPGVYCFPAAATLTGTLTLQGPASGIWIFRVGTDGTGALTGTNFSVVMDGGGEANNVFWWVAQAATQTDSVFPGNILAGAAITVTGGCFDGRALAKAAVTLTDTFVSADCSSFEPPPPGAARLLLIIDEDSIDNGTPGIERISFNAPFCGGGNPSVCVNDDIADPGVRTLLFTRPDEPDGITPYSGLVLPTGQVGDYGLFRFSRSDPQRSRQNGATFTRQQFITATGAAEDENNLDKIAGVVPLEAADIAALLGQTVCGVVYDSDISVTSVRPPSASLKGATLGLTAFTVTGVSARTRRGGSNLPLITVDLLGSEEARTVCGLP